MKTLLVLLPLWLFGQERPENLTCQAGVVKWHDAVIRVKDHGGQDLDKPQELLSKVVSFGCIRVKDGVVVIIHSFTDGRADDFLAIPANWATSIAYLKEDSDANSGRASPANEHYLALHQRSRKRKAVPSATPAKRKVSEHRMPAK